MRNAALVWLLLAFLFPLVATADEEAQETDTDYLRTLRKAGLTPTDKEVLNYLRTLELTDAQRQQASELIDKLSDDDWQTRRDATEALINLPFLPAEQLREALKSDDMEVSLRANLILERKQPQQFQLRRAVYDYLAERKPDGCVPVLLRTAGVTQDSTDLFMLRKALAACASEQHIEVLSEAARTHADTEVRLTAVEALAALPAEKSSEVLSELSEADHPAEVRLEAVIALLNRNRPDALASLLDLMADENADIRRRAGMAVASATRKDFGYAPQADPSTREEAIARFRAYFEEAGDDLELHLPVEFGPIARGDLKGMTLVAVGYDRNEVILVDEDGKIQWQCKAGHPYSAEKMRDGNYLISASSENKLIVVNPDRERIWEYGVNAANAKPLTNGNFLVADYRGQRAFEITPEKEIVWEYKTPDYCIDVTRLPGGTTLLASGADVLEVDAKGKELWKYTAPASVFSLQRLPSGNTLMAVQDAGMVIEISPSGETVWEYLVENPRDAFRLPDGHTLISAGMEVLEVTPEKTVVQRLEGGNYRSARR